MFNKELFYDLCNKYGVELSDEYSKPMIKTDGEVRQLEEQDVRDLLPRYQETVFYQNKSNAGLRRRTEPVLRTAHGSVEKPTYHIVRRDQIARTGNRHVRADTHGRLLVFHTHQGRPAVCGAMPCADSRRRRLGSADH